MKLIGQFPVVTVNSGMLRGSLNERVCAFKGVPFGERKEPHRRSSDIRPPTSWIGELDVSRPGKVFPQLRSRLAAVMGDSIDTNSQSEDAFVLNVWTPVNADSLPVFVFIHGGGFVSGGGSAPWYDSERLAGEGNIVVVTVNYRLGALGHCVDGDDPSGANRPVRDLLRALEWVQENIAQFGGDPGSVTVGGQSAGAWYSWLLGVSPASRGLLRRNILLSLPIVNPMAPDDVLTASQEFLKLANGKLLDSLSTEEILTAQVALMRSRMAFGEVAVGFRPAVEAGVVPEWLFDFRRAAKESHIGETLVGSTAEETASFMFVEPSLVNADEETARAWFAKRFGEDAPGIYEKLARRRPQHTPYTQFVDASSYMMFGMGVEKVSQAYSEAGKVVYPYFFNVQTGVPNLMSPHCLELPFLFGNRQGWADAPMLANTSMALFEHIGKALRTAVWGFVSDGIPRATSGREWQRCSLSSSWINEFSDGGFSTRRWEPGLLQR
ncbi:alpha/beta fold hydrolase [Cupriavidus consociatus]|uniref:alpha/beta fold hydrolase n=1 Tax=Cupriavidus consociatus TaxID=2821357 RepID=UPI001AEA1418|nr:MULTISPECIES: alpha/beta fold hydrolase [unclassified Cupriavidus]MBP0623693.1 carboxylesterase/lipase family protein [Cupriavidus sp. LEh25]MDK2660397.1 alpha/beta fold hydrolase [Cupriavidus sp. LEh21]